MRGVLAAVLLASSAAAAAGATFGTERVYQRSLADLQAGRYHKAMEGFMDVLLEDPSYPEARERLGEAGRRLLEEESRRVAAEREDILRSMRDMGRGIEDLRRRKEDARRVWEARLREAVGLVRSTAPLGVTLERYEDSLRLFPVYAGELDRFVGAREEFEQALLAAHPEAERAAEEARTRGRGEDTGALIEELLRRAKREEEWSPFGGLSVASLPEAGAKPEEHARRIADIELSKQRALRGADEALAQYKAGRYRDSVRSWKAVLEVEPEGPEAAFFLARAGRLAAAEGEGFVPARAAPARRALPAPARRARPAARKAPPASKAAPAAPEVRTPEDAARAEEAYQRGLKAYSVGKLDAAVAAWEECLKLAPDHPKARKALRRAANEKP